MVSSSWPVFPAPVGSISVFQALGRRYFRFGSPLFRHSDLLLGAVHCGSSVGSISDSATPHVLVVDRVLASSGDEHEVGLHDGGVRQNDVERCNVHLAQPVFLGEPVQFDV